jgi:CheY-like chemotaxis protein
MRGTVLVVDDDPSVQRCLGEFLRGEGYKVLSAPNGRAALAVLEDELPNLLLIDVAMPVMSGWKLVEALAHYPDLARIPRILMTSERDDPGSRRRVPRAPQVVEKPLDLSRLSSAMASMLRSRSSAAMRTGSSMPRAM